MKARPGILVSALVVGVSLLVWLGLRNPPPPEVHDGGAPASAVSAERVRVPVAEARTGLPEVATVPFAPSPEGPPAEGLPSEAALRVRVVDTDGAPVGGASVGLCRSNDDPLRPGDDFPYGVTGRDGRIAFRVRPNEARLLLVVTEARPPVAIELADGERERVVTLADPVAVSGVVRVDGQAPERPITLAIEGFHDPARGFGSSARQFLAACSRATSRMDVTTDAAGAFAVFGLEPGERVTITAPEPFRRRDGRGEATEVPSLSTSVVATGLVLDLALPRGVRGRAVATQQDFRTMIEGLELRYRFVADDRKRTEGSLAVQQGVPFLVPFPAPRIREYELALYRFGGTEPVTVRSASGDFDRTVDLGDLAYPETVRKLQVRVRDVAGAPVSGARVLAGSEVSARTDAEGRVSVPLLTDGARLVAGAPGFEVTELPVPVPCPATLEVTLVRAPMLRLSLRRPDGKTPIAGLHVALSMRGPPPDFSPELHAGFADVRGAANSGFESSRSSHTISYPIPDDGRLAVGGWPRDQEMLLVVRDRYGSQLFKEAVVLVGPTDVVIDRTLPTNPRDLSGRVETPDGAGIPGAMVNPATTPYGLWETTDADGRFTLRDAYAAKPVASVTAEGFVSRNVSAEELTSGRLVLERAHALWIEVIDAQGNRRDAVVTAATLAGGQGFAALRRGEGLYEIPGLPASLLRVVASGPDGSRAEEATIAPDQDRLRVVLARP